MFLGMNYAFNSSEVYAWKPEKSQIFYFMQT